VLILLSKGQQEKLKSFIPSSLIWKHPSDPEIYCGPCRLKPNHWTQESTLGRWSRRWTSSVFEHNDEFGNILGIFFYWVCTHMIHGCIGCKKWQVKTTHDICLHGKLNALYVPQGLCCWIIILLYWLLAYTKTNSASKEECHAEKFAYTWNGYDLVLSQLYYYILASITLISEKDAVHTELKIECITYGRAAERMMYYWWFVYW
jgi:hypothetical protein